MEDLKKHAINIRKNILEMVHAASSGHPGGSLSATDILTYLYFKEMNINAENLNSTNRDRFVLSKGHASPALYGVLMEKGLSNENPLDFRKLGSNLQGHPNMNEVPGVDMSTGSLGQGISAAVGMAIANKLDKNDNRIFVLCGDGETEEGIVWEALMAACHYKLDNLCVFVDLNHLQIDGKIEDVINPTPLDLKAKAFGCNVTECDGHDFESIAKAVECFKANCGSGVPTVIIANTVKGKGVSFMENNPDWHGSAPNDEQFAAAMAELKEAE